MSEKGYHEIKRVDRRYHQSPPEPPSRYLGKGPVIPGRDIIGKGAIIPGRDVDKDILVPGRDMDKGMTIPGRDVDKGGMIPGRDGVPINPMLEFDLEKTAPSKGDRGETYPPIVTIDGRVDTDIDHLIEDIADDYSGPVDEIPSKFPKPHVFSVIDGSLDDDVDSYANDDGTMEHTLVDAPKNFNPHDLKDVASPDRNRRQAIGQSKEENAHHNRSYNKMYVEPADNYAANDRPARDQSSAKEDDDIRSKKSDKDQHSVGDVSEDDSVHKRKDFESVVIPRTGSKKSISDGGSIKGDGSAEQHAKHKKGKSSEKHDVERFRNERSLSGSQNPKPPASDEVDPHGSERTDQKGYLSVVPVNSFQCQPVASSPPDGNRSDANSMDYPLCESPQFYSFTDRPLRGEKTNNKDEQRSQSVADINFAAELPRMTTFGGDEIKDTCNYFSGGLDSQRACPLETLEMRYVSDSDSFSKGSEVFLGRNYVDPFNFQSPSKNRLKEYFQSCQPNEAAIEARLIDSQLSPVSNSRQPSESYCADTTEQRPYGSTHHSLSESSKANVPADPNHYPTEEMKRQQYLKDDDHLISSHSFKSYITNSCREPSMESTEQRRQAVVSPTSQTEHISAEDLHNSSHTIVGNQSAQETSNKQQLHHIEIQQDTSDSCKRGTKYVQSPNSQGGPANDSQSKWLNTYEDYQSDFLRKELSQESGMGLGSVSCTERDVLTKDSGDKRISNGNVRSTNFLLEDPPCQTVGSDNRFSEERLLLFSKCNSIQRQAHSENRHEEETDSESLDAESYSLLCKLKAINDDKNKSQNLLRHVRQLLQDSELKRENVCQPMQIEGEHPPAEKMIRPVEVLHFDQKTLTGKGDDEFHVIKESGTLLAQITEDKPGKQIKNIELKKEKGNKGDKSKLTAGDKGGKQNNGALEKVNKPPKRVTDVKEDRPMMPVSGFQDTAIKDKKIVQSGKDDIKSEMKPMLQGKSSNTMSLNSKRGPAFNYDAWTFSEEEESWYDKPVWRDGKKFEVTPCSPCVSVNKRRTVSDRMCNPSKFMMDDRFPGAFPQRMKHPCDFYDTTSLTSTETFDVYSDFSAFDSESSVPSFIKKHIFDGDRRSVSVPRKCTKPIPAKRWQSPDPYADVQHAKRKLHGEVRDVRRKDFTKCTVKTSLRAAIRVAEESMSAAARVAEALDFVMRAGKLTSPTFSPSSSSEDDKTIQDFCKDKDNDKSLSPSGKSKRNSTVPVSKAKSKPEPEVAKTPKPATKKAQSTDRQSAAKDKKRAGSPSEKKKRPSTAHAKSGGQNQQKKTVVGKEDKKEEPNTTSKPPADKENQHLPEPIPPKPETRELSFKRTLSAETVPRSETNAGPRAVLSGTVKSCCAQHMYSRGPQVTIHIAYPKSADSSPKADKQLQINEESSQGQDQSSEHNHPECNPNPVEDTKAEASDCSQRSREIVTTGLEMGDYPMHPEIKIQPSVSQVSKDCDSSRYQNSQGEGDEDLISQCPEYLDDIEPNTWTLPISSYAITRKTEGYFSQAQPVIDPNLQGISRTAKHFYHSQLVGSCVDPFMDSHGSDTDSIEYNANFNKAPRDLNRLSSHSSCSDNHPDQKNQPKLQEVLPSTRTSRQMAWSISSDFFPTEETPAHSDTDDTESNKDSECRSLPSFKSKSSNNSWCCPEHNTFAHRQNVFPSPKDTFDRKQGSQCSEERALEHGTSGGLGEAKDTKGFSVYPETNSRRVGNLTSRSDKVSERMTKLASYSSAEGDPKPQQQQRRGSTFQQDRQLKADYNEEQYSSCMAYPPSRDPGQNEAKQFNSPKDSNVFVRRELPNSKYEPCDQAKLMQKQEDTENERRLLSQYLGEDQSTETTHMKQPKKARAPPAKQYTRHCTGRDWDLGQRTGRDTTRRIFSPIYEDIWHEDHDNSGSDHSSHTIWSDYRAENNKNANNNDESSGSDEEDELEQNTGAWSGSKVKDIDHLLPGNKESWFGPTASRSKKNSTARASTEVQQRAAAEDWRQTAQLSGETLSLLKKDASPLTSDLNLDTSMFLSRQPLARRSCNHSRNIQPEPFGEVVRLDTLPPVEPVSRMPKVTKPFQRRHLYERDPGRYNQDRSLCHRLALLHRKGRAIGRGTIQKQFVHPNTINRMSEQESIARANEKIFHRLLGIDSQYSREKMLKDYEDRLPRLVGFSRMPGLLMERYGINSERFCHRTHCTNASTSRQSGAADGCYGCSSGYNKKFCGTRRCRSRCCTGKCFTWDTILPNGLSGCQSSCVPCLRETSQSNRNLRVDRQGSQHMDVHSAVSLEMSVGLPVCPPASHPLSGCTVIKVTREPELKLLGYAHKLFVILHLHSLPTLEVLLAYLLDANKIDIIIYRRVHLSLHSQDYSRTELFPVCDVRQGEAV